MATVSMNLPACLPHSLHLWHWPVKRTFFTAELQAKAELSSVKKRVMAQKLWDLSQQAEEKNSQSVPTQGKSFPSDKNNKKSDPTLSFVAFEPRSLS